MRQSNNGELKDGRPRAVVDDPFSPLSSPERDSEEMRVDRIRKSSKKSHVVLDMGMFESTALRNEVVFESAIGMLEGFLRVDAVDHSTIVKSLTTHQNLLEFIIAGKPLF